LRYRGRGDTERRRRVDTQREEERQIQGENGGRYTEKKKRGRYREKHENDAVLGQ
jgi:hypothetical protein